MNEVSRLTEIVSVIQMLEKENINIKKAVNNILSSTLKKISNLFSHPKDLHSMANR